MSKDLNDSTKNNIWQMSNISLPKRLKGCKCMITHKNTKNPKVIVLGCSGYYFIPFLEYELCDIIGYHTFQSFMVDLATVILY